MRRAKVMTKPRTISDIFADAETVTLFEIQDICMETENACNRRYGMFGLRSRKLQQYQRSVDY
jgi:hypothetical protein